MHEIKNPPLVYLTTNTVYHMYKWKRGYKESDGSLSQSFVDQWLIPNMMINLNSNVEYILIGELPLHLCLTVPLQSLRCTQGKTKH